MGRNSTSSVPPSSFILSLKEFSSRGGWVIVAFAQALAAFMIAPWLLKTVWADWVGLFRDFYIGDFFAGDLACAYVSSLIANVGQETIWMLVMLPIYVYRPAVFEPYRINLKPVPYTTSFILWSVARVLFNNLVIAPLIFVPTYIHAKSAYNAFDNTLASFPSYSTIALSICAGLLIEDAMFYWSHRLLHTQWLYQRIHKIHHQYYVNVALASEHAHPVEFTLGNLVPLAVPAILLRMHTATFILFVAARIFVSAEEHCGYAFPWSPCKLLPFQTPAKSHDFHHSHNTGMFASQFMWWDWFCGTDKTYRAHQQELLSEERKKL